MSVQLEQSAPDDPTSLLSAAARIRHGQRPAARRGEARMRLAASRLLEAVGAAVARDRASVPMAVRRTAAALAAEASRPDLRAGDVDGAEMPAGPRAAGSRPPFTASIRLGRMG